MLRIALGAVVGYIVLGVLVAVLLTVTAIVMGPQRVYADASWQPSVTWCLASLGVGLVTATVAGLVAALIAASRWGGFVLCSLVCVIGLMAAIFSDATPPADAPPRPAQMGFVDYLSSAAYSRVPKWVDWGNVAVGVAGTLIGARLYVRRRPSAQGTAHA
jgi:hypothetical protein